MDRFASDFFITMGMIKKEVFERPLRLLYNSFRKHWQIRRKVTKKYVFKFAVFAVVRSDRRGLSVLFPKHKPALLGYFAVKNIIAGRIFVRKTRQGSFYFLY